MRLLIIDDSEQDCHALRAELEHAAPGLYIFHEVHSPFAAVNAVLQFEPDCILLDFRMPEGDGFEVLAQLKDKNGDVTAPIIMLTGQGDEETAVRALKAGASDYIPKRCLFAGLHERVITAHEQFQQVSARRAANERVRYELSVRDELLAVMAHELRTPLTALALNLSAAQHSMERLKQTVAQTQDLQATDTRLNRARAQIGRFERLIGNLTEATRFENGGLQLHRAPMDMGALANRVVSELMSYAERAGVRLSGDVVGRMLVYGDATRLEQVLSNLISNAIKYGGRSPVCVTTVVDGDDAMVRVIDDGPGIRASDQARIFERYERASHASRADSLGLGLYISRQLARSHGGDLTVQSVPQQGATFELRIPLCSQVHVCNETTTQ